MAQSVSHVAARGPQLGDWTRTCRWNMGPDGWANRACGGGWSLWVGATATAEIPCQVAWDQPAVIEAAGTYAVQGGLIGDWTITSFEKIASGPVRRVEGAEVSSGPADVQRDRRASAISCSRCASAADRGPRSASGAGSSPERAPTRSAGATRAFPDAADGLVMVDTRTWRAVSTFCIGNLMVRGRTPSRAGRRRLHRDAGVLVDGRSSGRRGDGDRSPACHRGLGRRRDVSGIG